MAEKHNFSLKEEFAMKLVPPTPANANDAIK
jgi:intraflagellar transport protein 140